MAFGHLLDTYWSSFELSQRRLGASRRATTCLAHLPRMDTETARETARQDPFGSVLTLSQLAAHLCVSAQTLYDLRSKGRGPRGFRVGRELRFRTSEVDDWLTRLEAADGNRHAPQVEQ